MVIVLIDWFIDKVIFVFCFWDKYVPYDSFPHFAHISSSSGIYLALPPWGKPFLWYRLSVEWVSFMCICISIYSVSLHELCENEEDNVVLAFEQLSETFFEKFNNIWKRSLSEVIKRLPWAFLKSYFMILMLFVGSTYMMK